MKEVARILGGVLGLALACPCYGAQAAPREGVWVSYQGHLYSSDVTPTAGGIVSDEGDGFIPAFSLRLRNSNPRTSQVELLPREATGVSRTPTVHMIPSDDGHSPPREWQASELDGATLVLRFAQLPLPDESSETAVSYRAGIANGRWRWLATGLRSARDVAANVDLGVSDEGPAAALCRTVTVAQLTNVTSDTCRIEGIVDRTSGWALVARISRTVAAANGARASRNVTFEQLPATTFQK